MRRLNFGLYARRLKGASSLDKVEIVEILVDGLIEGSGDIIDTSDKYKLFNSKLDRQDLKESCSNN